MRTDEAEDANAPIWARPDAFPKAPPLGWGWIDLKARPHPCVDEASLIQAIQEDRNASVALVWTPNSKHLILPEELPSATSAVLASRRRRALDDRLDAIDKLRWFGSLMIGLALYLFYRGWTGAPAGESPSEQAFFATQVVLTSMSMGIALLMFLIFAFIPWYQATKRVAELGRWNAEDLAGVVPLIRFETWLEWQKAPVTRILLGLMILVGAAQLLPGDSLAAAGLLKDRYHSGEWWRLFTAPFLHGHPLHFMMNAAALVYLGKRIEVFARWPHVPLVFLFAACVGGEASARFLHAPSVGASGGLMGWLGFLLIFESLHGRLVPRKARKRLAAGILLTGLIGLIGYRFIDNAAHIGGLLAGMLYALIVFPKSTSPMRPVSTITDKIAGGGALALLTLAALFAVARMLGAA